MVSPSPIAACLLLCLVHTSTAAVSRQQQHEEQLNLLRMQRQAFPNTHQSTYQHSNPTNLKYAAEPDHPDQAFAQPNPGAPQFVHPSSRSQASGVYADPQPAYVHPDNFEAPARNAGTGPQPGAPKYGEQPESMLNRRQYSPNVFQRQPSNQQYSGLVEKLAHNQPQKYYSAPAVRGGPNKCNGGRNCCPGWSSHPATRLCIVPVCRFACGFGICRSPNLCQCVSGQRGQQCGAGGGDVANTCQKRCLNGANCAEGKCQCQQGYVGDDCGKPVCNSPCQNKGRCIGPDRCACPYGFTGKQCEQDHRVGPCFTRIEDGYCRGLLMGVKCSRESCCNTVGAAWGIPCDRCPEKRDCPRGYFKDILGNCKDINECRGIPNICAMGTCVNTEGSYKCVCGTGRTYNANKFECSDINECEVVKNLCAGGTCTNLDGSFKCSCPPNFKLSASGKRCLAPTVYDICFRDYAYGGCLQPSPAQVSKHNCCCGNPARAFGTCTQCPRKGTVAYSVLGCADDPDPEIPKGNDKDATGKGGDGKGDGSFVPPTGPGGVVPPGGQCVGSKADCGEPITGPTDPTTHTVGTGPDGTQQCTDSGLCENGKCEGAASNPKCVCGKGFAKNANNYCADLNECSKYPGNCGRAASCVNTKGGFRCEAIPGVDPTGKTGDGKFIPPTGPGGSVIPGGKCTGSTADCGNELTGVTDPTTNTVGTGPDGAKQCTSIGACDNGVCQTSGGEDKCLCKKGFKKNRDNYCADHNECAAYPGNCGKKSKCVNTAGGFRCEIIPGAGTGGGYIPPTGPGGTAIPGGTCTGSAADCGDELTGPVDPATHTVGTGPDGKEQCSTVGNCDNGVCQGLGGDPKCLCKKGFAKNGGNYCADLNECSKYPGTCGKGSRCVNTRGGFRCEVLPGTPYVPPTGPGGVTPAGGACTGSAADCGPPLVGVTDPVTGTVGTGPDGKVQCLGQSRCDNGVCTVSADNVVCACKKGFAKNQGNYCADLNECVKYPGNCGKGAKCVNTKGGFRCEVGTGPSESDCKLFGVCEGTGSGGTGTGTGTDGDGTGSSGTGTGGGGNGVTPPTGTGGKSGADGGCIGSKANCGPVLVGPTDPLTNTVGDGPDGTEQCAAEGACENGACVDGKCVCSVGFKKNRNNYCADLNECAAYPDACKDSKCLNTKGGFRCMITTGTVCVGSEADCGEVLTGPTDPDTHTVGTGEDSTAQCARESVCDNGDCMVIKNRINCLCKKGFAKNKDNYCADLNECSKFSGLCQGGKCLNTRGGFRCMCPAGYISGKDKMMCDDINECLDGNKCANGECVNFKGTYQCRCNAGYKPSDDGKLSCVDINECDQPNICPEGKCNNNVGGFECACSDGYTRSADNQCVDVDECAADKDLCKNGYCINVPGGYQCQCPTGFVEKGTVCEDVDECSTVDDACYGGICINGPGSYRCKCNAGFKVASDGKACYETRVDECFAKYSGNTCDMPLPKQLTRMECCCGMENTGLRAFGVECSACPKKGSKAFKRVCPHGEGMMGPHMDIDECKNNAGMVFGICKNGKCSNMMKDFMCVCNDGFKSSPLSNKLCDDIDECKEINNFCRGGRCENSIGGYQCHCPTGYQFNMNSRSCEDVNECEMGSPCIGGYCKNLEGSYKCECPAGTHLNNRIGLCEDRRVGRCFNKLTDDSKCEKPNAGLMSKSECCNSVGLAWGAGCDVCDATTDPSSNGGCPKGYRRDGIKCLDIDECSRFDHICPNGRCENTEGGYRCICPPGYELDPSGKACIDMRSGVCYRLVKKGVCGMPFGELFSKAACCCSAFSQAWGSPCEVCPLKNSDAFKELCPNNEGFHRNGTDINECNFQEICKNGACTNMKGGFKCECDTGFDMDESNSMCVDVDECTISPGICGRGKCINTIGSFRCACNAGFRNNMMMEMCEDINECEEGNPPPCAGGRCVNTEGSFQCQCPRGMRVMGPSIACEDIDECSENPNICPDGECQNFRGGYQCRCNSGFRESRDMLQCIDIDECNTDNGGCEYSCRNLPGSFQCGCQEGYELKDDGASCKDIDECTIGTPCGEGNACTNTIGGHVCTCIVGFRQSFDGKACVDVDECREDEHACMNGRCINTVGSFLCQCEQGYVLDTNAMVCIDVDECKREQNGGCHPDARCLNNVGSFSCQCKQGYNGDGYKCEDINECLVGLGQCNLDAECVNTVGSYTCQCKSGYNGDGVVCIDINECVEDDQLCRPGNCMNTEGSFKCDCGTGYSVTSDGRSCQDIDECSDPARNACDHGHCINTIGGFTCQCKLGFQLHLNKMECVDVNECSATGMCLNGRCENMMGMYKCICNEADHFMPNDNHTSCIDKRMGYCYSKYKDPTKCGGMQLSPRAMMKQDCCCTGPDGSSWQNDADEMCEACPRMLEKEYKGLCPGGTSTTTDGTGRIVKHNGCDLLTAYCKGGACTDTGEKGISCQCPMGVRFVPELLACQDVDECTEVPGICGYGAQCTNSVGSYQCTCAEGQDYDPIKKFCVDNRKMNCYSPILNPKGSCNNPFPIKFKISKCCCGFGDRPKYGDSCTTCPTPKSADWNALCLGKPKIPKYTSGQPPIGARQGGVLPTIDPNAKVPIDANGRPIGPDGKPLAPLKKDKDGNLIDADGNILQVTPDGRVIGPDGQVLPYDKDGFPIGPDGKRLTLGLDGLPVNLNPDGTVKIPVDAFGRPVGPDGKVLIKLKKDKDGNLIDADGNILTISADGKVIGPDGKILPYDKDGNPLAPDGRRLPTGPDGSALRINKDGSVKVPVDKFGRPVGPDGKVLQKLMKDKNGNLVDKDGNIYTVTADGKVIGPDGNIASYDKDGNPLKPDGTKLILGIDGKVLPLNPDGSVQIPTDRFGRPIGPDGKVLKKLKVDGNKLVDADGNVIGIIQPDGTVTSLDGKTVLPYNKDGVPLTPDGKPLALTPDGTVIPINPDGTIKTDFTDLAQIKPKPFVLVHPLDKSGRPTGPDGKALVKLTKDKDGNLVDADGNIVGKVLPDGSVVGLDGKPLPYDADGDPIGADGRKLPLGPDGKVLPLNPDGTIRKLEKDAQGRLIGLDGNPLPVDENGRPLGPDGKLLPYDKDGNPLGLDGKPLVTLPDGTIIDPRSIPDTPDINPLNDVDECAFFPDICGKGTCVNTAGAYTCTCDAGYISTKLNGKLTCADVDECESSPCIEGACINFPGGYSCECDEGMQLDGSGNKCVDLNECSTEGYCDNGICENIRGGFKCTCNSGYMLTIDGKTCQDLDECLMPELCGAGTCENTPGSYKCNCDFGYKEGPSGKCEDINECSAYPDLCRNGQCKNLIGSYMCECEVGFQPDAKATSCQDINECNEPGFCEHGSCRNTIGSAICTCDTGFERSEDGRTCLDVDECLDPGNDCRFGGECVNTAGGFVCKCNDGFVSGPDRRVCLDRRVSFCFSKIENDQCAMSNALDVSKSTCCCSMGAGWGDPCELCPDPKTEEGALEYKYLCPQGPGYLNNNFTDINECEANLGRCENAKCVNTDGSFACECLPGYKKSANGLICVDKDECVDEDNACGSGTCTNLVGTFSCKCDAGFRPGKDSPSCVDINECAEQKGLCAYKCKNLIGSYMCACPRGFKLADDGKHCEDINECLKPGKFPSGICPYGCKNLVGGYRCICPDGMRQTAGGGCEDIDECAQTPTLCRPGGFCQNIQGGYRCDCVPPFMASDDYKMCLDKRLGTCFANSLDGLCEAPSDGKKLEKVSQRDCCCGQAGSAWGPQCAPCPALFSPEHETLCIGHRNRTINECEVIAGVCKNGKCMDTTLGFRCMCNEGYKLSMSGKKCEDIDECASPTKNQCGEVAGGSCQNIDGSHECICPAGFNAAADKKSCVDEDECATGRHNCEMNCHNNIGGFSCSCANGYEPIGSACKDINECLQQGICGAGTCNNVAGSFECICTRGLKYDEGKKACVYIDKKPEPGPDPGTGTDCLPQGGCPQQQRGCPTGFYPYSLFFGQVQCVDVNECLQSMCGQQSSCVNEIGSYRCTCGNGFKYGAGGCEDINECSGGGVFGTTSSPCSYACENNQGGFACRCPKGYYPVQGGTCVATYGATCYECDTSDIPDEVPLSTGSAGPAVSRHQSAIVEGEVPLAAYHPQYQPTQAQRQYLQPQYQQFAGQRQVYGGEQSSYGGDPYGVGVVPNSYGQQQQQQTYGQQYQWSSQQYQYRKRRSASDRKPAKPFQVNVKHDTNTTVSLVKIMPILKAMQKAFDYHIHTGNTTLFELRTASDGRGATLHATRMLPMGTKHYIVIKGSVRENTTVNKGLQAIYKDAKKFEMRVLVSVVG